MEKMLLVLTIIQLLISFYWLFNGIVFYKVQAILDHCQLCFYNSLFSIFSHSIYAIFFMFTFHNLRTILINPIDGILKFHNRLLFYLSSSIILSILITFIAFKSKLCGVSVKKLFM